MNKTRLALRDKRILIVDPLGECLPLAKKLVTENFERTILAHSFADLMRILVDARANGEGLDLLVVSLKLPECIGVGGLKPLRQSFDGPLLVVADSTEHRDIHMMQNIADDCFVHTQHADLFLMKVERLLVRRILRDQVGLSTYRNETLFLNILAVMAKVLEAKDPNTRFHSEKVSMLASNIAREMHFTEEEVKRVSIAGILHDIGKMGVPEAILRKNGPLNPAERQQVERHPVIAAQILEPIEKLKSAVSYIRHHHERYDGAGYPDQLAGEMIPLGARILHVAEAFDSMVTKRSYSDTLQPDEALAEIQSCAGRQFDPHVVDALTAILKRSKVLAPTSEPAKSLPQLIEEINM